MLESVIQNKIRCELSSADRVLFRANSGEFFQGKQVFSKEFNQPVLINLRKVDGLPKGFSDLFAVDCQGVAFIETKTLTGKPSPEQIKFINRMRQLGHRAGIARSVEEALEIVNNRT